MRKLATLFLLAVLALPAFAANQVTVNDLEQAVAAAHGKSDKEVAQQLADLELTQRLSTVRLEHLQAGLPGDKSRLALRAIADASAFFDLPAADILPQAGPDSATQGKIMSRAADFAEATISKLPDFFATRTTTRFENQKLKYEAHGMVTLANRSFGLVDRFSATVTYRNGREVVEAAGGKKGRSNMSSSTGLTSWGEFGPLLGVVVEDILKGKMGWSHWEQGPVGPVAVFRYMVPADRSNYTVRYCCFMGDGGKMRDFEGIPQYHGEIAVDPTSGAVFRLVVETDLDPTVPIYRADVAVEYSPVEIGGKSYICPVKSISITTAADFLFHGVVFYNGTITPRSIVEPKVTAINDLVFDNYHLFRTEMRILPAETADPNRSPPAPTTPPAAPPIH